MSLNGWLSSPSGRFTQSLTCALFVGWLSDASMAETMLMFMVLRMQTDAYYERACGVSK